MPDGDTVRLRQGRGPGDVLTVETAVCFVRDGSYRYEAGPINRSLNSPPSDSLMWDAPRAQLDLGETGFDITRPYKVVTVFVVPDWAGAHHNMTCVWEMHEPGVHKSGPIMGSIRDGHLFVAGKRSAAPVSDGPGNLRENYGFDAGPVTPGEVMAIVWDIHHGNHLRLHRVTATGVEELVNVGGGWGWVYDDPRLNREFRPQCFKTYPFLRWHPDHDDAQVSGVPNWDESFGPIRRFAHIAFALDPDWSTANAVAYARAVLPAAPTTTPDPPPVGLEAEVAALRADLADLTSSTRARLDALDAEIASQRDGWSAVAAIARATASQESS